MREHISRNVDTQSGYLSDAFPRRTPVLARSDERWLWFNQRFDCSSVSTVSAGISIAWRRHVGYLEQHSGAQEAAGLSQREAAAAAERPSTTVRWYVHATHCLPELRSSS